MNGPAPALHVLEPSAEEPAREFGVVQPFPVIELDDDGEMIRPPRQYTTIADRPEQVRVAA